jgi:hypothetical protein
MFYQMRTMKASQTTIFCILLVVASLAFIDIPEVSAYSYNSYNSAYPYIYNPDIYPVYSIYGSDYYSDYDKYNNIPVVAGPFPRGYIAPQNFKYDDYHHYDEFIGYSDLDVFNPQTGVVEVIRNTNSQPLDRSQLPENVTWSSGHVYGYIPGPDGTWLMYKKHYGDDHPWDLEEDYGYYDTYGYGYNYDYYSQLPYYRTTQATCTSCQERSICQLTHNCA